MANDFFESIEAVPLEENAAIVAVLLRSDLVSVWDGKFTDLHGWQSSNAILIDSARVCHRLKAVADAARFGLHGAAGIIRQSQVQAAITATEMVALTTSAATLTTDTDATPPGLSPTLDDHEADEFQTPFGRERWVGLGNV